MKCSYCGYEPGDHALACPESELYKNTGRALDEWATGYRIGRSGNLAPIGSRPTKTWLLGYRMGECALEEYENGYDVREE